MNKQQLDQAITDYTWMLSEVIRIRSALAEAGNRLTPPYGESTGLPKPQGGYPNNPVHVETAERERKWAQLREYEGKIEFIQSKIHKVKDNKTRAMLNCTLDGMQPGAVAARFNCSVESVRRARREAIEQMLEDIEMPRL